jgi:WD40 repeat protein
MHVFEGHTSPVKSVAWNAKQQYALSGSWDKTVRLWDMDTRRCLRVLEGHTGQVINLAWSSDRRRAFSGDLDGGIRVWELSKPTGVPQVPEVPAPAVVPVSDQVQYTNAKVLLVGESGVGKTGLSKVLAGEKWEPSDSTVGA